MKKEKLKLLLPDESGLNASLFVSIIAIVLGLAYYLARFGFENNSFFRIVLIVGLSLFLIFFPEALDLLRLRRKDPKYWYNLKPLNLMLGLLLLIILGAIVSVVNLLYLVSAFGILLFVFFLYFHLRYLHKGKYFLVILMFALALSGWAIGVLWGRNLLNPLYLERMALGKIPIDAVFHSSVVSMIKAHWIPSTGLDGVPYLQYHWGSHYIFAQISKLLNLNSVDFYNLAYPVIFTPFIIRSFIYFIEIFRRLHLRTRSALNWFSYLLILFSHRF